MRVAPAALGGRICRTYRSFLRSGDKWPDTHLPQGASMTRFVLLAASMPFVLLGTTHAHIPPHCVEEELVVRSTAVTTTEAVPTVVEGS